MLPQIGMSEMLLLGMLALVVLGPRDLSLMMRRAGRWTGKLRAMAWEFRQSFEEIGRQAELGTRRRLRNSHVATTSCGHYRSWAVDAVSQPKVTTSFPHTSRASP